MNRRELAPYLLIVAFTFMSWRVTKASLTPAVTQHMIEYLLHAPNCYRVFSYVILLLDEAIFSLWSWNALIFAVSMSLTYYLIPDERVVIVAGVLAATGATLNAPMYPLLALGGPLVLLVLIKEHAAYLLVCSLLLAKKYSQAIIGVLLASVLFVVVRIVVGSVPYHPMGAPLFTLPYILTLQDWTWPLMSGVLTVSMLVVTKPDSRLLLLNLPIVFLFGLWWEPQLWAPVVVLSEVRT